MDATTGPRTEGPHQDSTEAVTTPDPTPTVQLLTCVTSSGNLPIITTSAEKPPIITTTTTEPSVTVSSIDQPSSNPPLEQKPGIETPQRDIPLDSTFQNNDHIYNVQAHNPEVGDGVEAEQKSTNDGNDEPKLDIPESSGDLVEPTVIPESQETVNQSNDDIMSPSEFNSVEEGKSKNVPDTKPSLAAEAKESENMVCVGETSSMEPLVTDDAEYYKEVTVDSGIAQMRIQGDDDDDRGEPDDRIIDVLGVVDYMVKTVDDHLEGRISDLTERTALVDQRTEELNANFPVGVPMDVDPPTTDIQKEGERTEGNDMIIGDAQGKPTGGEEKVEDKIDEDIDPTWKTEDFDLPPSDEEGDTRAEPSPHVIVELYQKLERERILDLEWTCLGRRTPDHDLESMVVEESDKDDKEEEADQPLEEDPTEFDFDIDAVIQNKVTPRRTPGFEPKGSGSAKRRVANMDKVIGDIIRFSKIDEEMEKTGDATATPAPAEQEGTPQRPLGKFHIRRDLHQ